MTLTLKKILLLLLAVLPAVTQAQKKPGTSPTPSWLVPCHPNLQQKPNAKHISDGFYLLLAETQYHAELKSDYHHYIRQIISEAGIQNGSEISVDYDPQYEKLTFHRLVVKRDGQEINRLPGAAFKVLQQEEELSRFIYSGTYTAYLILEDVRKGDQIEYSYSLTGSNPIFDQKVDEQYYQVATEPVVNYYRNIIARPERQLHFKPFNDAALPQQRNWNGFTVYEWNTIRLQENDNISNLPSWYNPFTRLQVSEYNNWQEIARWAQHINTTAAPGPAVQNKIAALKQQAGNNPEAYLQAALRFVQDDIRYMGIEMGEYSHRPNTPDRVLAQRFGDCKDKSLLLCTLLNANGISAHMAYVNTELKGRVAQRLPSPTAFNHAIVYAILRGKTYWLDATLSYQRGSLASFCEPDYQLALVITDTTTRLTPIHKINSGHIAIRETLTLPAEEGQDGALRASTAWYREDADEQRAALAAASLQDKEATFLAFYRKFYGDMTLKDSMAVRDNPDSNVLRVQESYVIRHLWKKDSATNKLLFSVIAQSPSDILPYVTDGNRKTPLAIKYPYDLDYQIMVNTPIEWSLEQTPLHIKNDYYQFDFTATRSGKQIVLAYTLKTFQDHVPVAFMPQYAREIREIQKTTSLDLYLRPAFVQPVSQPGNRNWLAVVLAICSAAVFAYLAKQYYQHSVLPVRYPLEPLPIGGWLSLLAIGLVFSPMFELIVLCKAEVFNYETWATISARKDMGNISLVQLFLIGEVIIRVFMLCYSVLLAVLFFNRRDTFPFALATYYFITTLYLFFFNRINSYYFGDSTQGGVWTPNSILWPLLRMALWVPYLLTSPRAKATFIMPHPARLED
ncbi:DUF3857 domain-containing protein [Chitinophaga qingshengii]|uniref:DUF3857 domain-containing protein n=1 Tax=Chitinophaga qingshengii TaxID=1569794 RepID=A0ABR7TMN8_9BACT|nr:DUF3857 domain-containing protein [Chitinophaga qingshengii]MBC9931747.1 DUF3857 domain-containing protein [Chitinophaga qingshengii]